MSKIQTLKIKDFTWLNISNAQKEELDYLRRKYKFHPLDLADAHVAKYAQRPKINEYPDYLFLILQFPFYNRQKREIIASEIDFFIGSDFFITMHDGRLPPVDDFFKNCSTDKFYTAQKEINDPATLLYEILFRLLKHCLPMLDHVSLDIANIEDEIFNGREREMVKEILVIKRNIINFRKIMQAHKNVINRLLGFNNKFFYAGRLKEYYNNLIDQTKNIWDILENHKETIDALEETNSSFVSFKLNDTMRVLTTISVLTFPATLLAALFAIRPASGMPFADMPYGFWAVFCLIGVLILSMFLFFKRQKWM